MNLNHLPTHQPELEFTPGEKFEAALIALSGIGSQLLGRPIGGDITNPTAMLASGVRDRVGLYSRPSGQRILDEMNRAIPTRFLRDRYKITGQNEGGPVGNSVVVSKRSVT